MPNHSSGGFHIGAYAKAVVAFLTPVLLAVQAAVTDGHITQSEGVGVGVAALLALGVYSVKNKPYPDPANPGGVV